MVTVASISDVAYHVHILSPLFHPDMRTDQVDSNSHHFGMEGHKQLLHDKFMRP